MINITFPDGSVRQYESGVSAFDIANSISPRLAADVLAATVIPAADTTGKGSVYDVTRPITEDAAIRLHKWEDAEAKHVFWHSSSHLLAAALEALYPGVKFGIGPAIEIGFYYDVDFGDKTLVEADLKAIEDKMIELARQKNPFVRTEVSKEDALRHSLRRVTSTSASLSANFRTVRSHSIQTETLQTSAVDRTSRIPQ